MFKVKALVDFEYGGKVIKKDSEVLVPGWMFSSSIFCSKVFPLHSVNVERGFKCALMTAEGLKVARNKKLELLEVHKSKIQDKYDKAIKGLEL